jgi:hypothetical protein
VGEAESFRSGWLELKKSCRGRVHSMPRVLMIEPLQQSEQACLLFG